MHRLLSLGYSLVHTKNLTDLFLDLEEEILEPWFSAGLTITNLDAMITVIMGNFVNVLTNNG